MSSFANATYPPHRLDLGDGRVLAPGEQADDVDEQDPHNKRLIESGALIRAGEVEPRDEEEAPEEEPPPEEEEASA